MQTVIIVIHLLVVTALVGVVLIQRSEGGGLGIGGGSGFMTARGTKNTLTRLTAILALCFFLTSISLTVMQLVPNKNGADILRRLPGPEQKNGANGLLDSLGGAKPGAAKTDAGSVSQSAGGQAEQNPPVSAPSAPAGAEAGGSGLKTDSAAAPAPQNGQGAAQPKSAPER